MIRSTHGTDKLSMGEKVAAACRDAGEQVIERAERTGTEVVVWRDGKIVSLSAAAARSELEQKQERSSGNG